MQVRNQVNKVVFIYVNSKLLFEDPHQRSIINLNLRTNEILLTINFSFNFQQSIYSFIFHCSDQCSPQIPTNQERKQNLTAHHHHHHHHHQVNAFNSIHMKKLIQTII